MIDYIVFPHKGFILLEAWTILGAIDCIIL